MFHKYMPFVVLSCGALFILAILAYLFWGHGERPKTDYDFLFRQAETREDRLHWFILAEPEGVHRIADPLTLRFGVVYDSSVWEVPRESFERMALPLPRKFEVQGRKIRSAHRGKFDLVEVSFSVQCLECRDEIDIPDFNGSFIPRAKNKETGDVRSARAEQYSRIIFAPLTGAKAGHNDSLIRAMEKRQDMRLPIVLYASASVLAAISIFLFFYLRRPHTARGVQETRKEMFLLRIDALREELHAGESPNSIGNSVFYLIWTFRKEFGDFESDDVDTILSDLTQIYSKEGIQKEFLNSLIGRFKDYVEMREGEEQK